MPVTEKHLIITCFLVKFCFIQNPVLRPQFFKLLRPSKFKTKTALAKTGLKDYITDSLQILH